MAIPEQFKEWLTKQEFWLTLGKWERESNGDKSWELGNKVEELLLPLWEAYQRDKQRKKTVADFPVGTRIRVTQNPVFDTILGELGTVVAGQPMSDRFVYVVLDKDNEELKASGPWVLYPHELERMVP